MLPKDELSYIRCIDDSIAWCEKAIDDPEQIGNPSVATCTPQGNFAWCDGYSRLVYSDETLGNLDSKETRREVEAYYNAEIKRYGLTRSTRELVEENKGNDTNTENGGDGGNGGNGTTKDGEEGTTTEGEKGTDAKESGSTTLIASSATLFAISTIILH